MSSSPEQRPGMRSVPMIAGAGVFLALAAIRAGFGFNAFRHIVKIWGIDAWEFPFLDTDTVLSAVRCIRQGIDVYVANPCDPLGRIFDYSPLWMGLSVLPMTLGWLTPIGLVVVIAFLASLLLLPPARSRGDSWLIALGVVSSAAVFAVERANNDLVLFALAAGAAALAIRSGAVRFVGYALALVAGLLKYYPLTLMAVAAREKPSRLALVTMASILAVALFVVVTWSDLSRALGLIPTGDTFGDMFGSVTVARGLVDIGLLRSGAGGAVRWAMTAVALGAGLGWGLRPGFADQLATLDRRERAFLLVGALLILGCFFTAQNIGYRAVHLILTLPALTALRWRRATAVALLILWSECWRGALRAVGKAVHLLDATTTVSWLAREALWWWLVTLLIACVTGWLWRSEAATAIRARIAPGSPAIPL